MATDSLLSQTTYMKLVAKSVYFLPPATNQVLSVQVKKFEKRLWLRYVTSGLARLRVDNFILVTSLSTLKLFYSS